MWTFPYLLMYSIIMRLQLFLSKKPSSFWPSPLFGKIPFLFWTSYKIQFVRLRYRKSKFHKHHKTYLNFVPIAIESVFFGNMWPWGCKMNSQISQILKYFFTYLTFMLFIFSSLNKKGRLFLLENLACRIQFKLFLFNFLWLIFN